MGFLHPWVLAGLVAAGVPILLHLIQRREPPLVVFPAVRYLVDTTREHQKRLKLRNWLLLIIRTLLIATLVLAAAGPTAPIRGAAGHSPAAVVVILDNSLSSGAVVNGTSRYSTFRAVAHRILARATSEDRLWLMLADGLVRRGDANQLRKLIDSASPVPLRLDLGLAINKAEAVLATDGFPGEVILLTDLQASAVSAADVRRPLLVIRPEDPESRNLGISAIDPGPQPWSLAGSRVTLSVTGDSALAVPVSIRIDDRPPRQALATVGSPVSASLGGTPAGWWPVRAELDPDELLADNQRTGVVRVAPVARVSWDTTLRYLAAACEVLVTNGRISRGNEVTVGRLAPGFSIVEPPSDPAELGAINRALDGRGVGWRFGEIVVGSATTDSGPLVGHERVERRYTLRPVGSGRTGVMATVNGAPWIVRSGGVVLLGSIVDPAWTSLPISAGFMPFMDGLINRVARGELTMAGGFPGVPVPLPDLVNEVRFGEHRYAVEGGAPFLPSEAGIHYLMAGLDTVGALAVNFDSRESLLKRADDASARDLWHGATITSPEDGPDRAFSLGVRSDLRGALLWAACLLGLGEVLLASIWRKTA
ncbi:MAG: BatA and WFA domain-containing protein [Gemmatimonadota bacterium]